MKLCTACRRHVRETTCPFCGADSLREVARGIGIASGVSRARLVAGVTMLAATTSVAALEACASGTSDPGPLGDAAAADAKDQDTTIVAAYGLPPADASPKDATFVAPDAAYGAPPFEAGPAPAYGAPAK